MKFKFFLTFALLTLVVLVVNTPEVMAQCSVCSKVTSDLGDGIAKGLNAGILYLAAFPLSIIGYMGFRWYKNSLPDEE